MKVLIYLQLLIYTFKTNKEYFVTIVLIFLVSTANTDYLEIEFYFSCYLTGYLISANHLKFIDYVPRFLGLSFILMPIMFSNQLYTYEPRLYVFTVLAFSALIKIKSNHQIKILEYFSNNGLEYLTFQYLIIESLLRLNYNFTNIYIVFIIILSITTVLVWVYNKVNQIFKEELSKI